MRPRLSPSSGRVLGLLALLGGPWGTSGCGNTNPDEPATGAGGVSSSGGSGGTAAGPTSGGGGGSATGGVALGGAATGGGVVDCIPEAIGETTHEAGNYDNLSCNKAGCHTAYVGGWVYASARGYPWIGGATVTITNADGTKLTAVSGADGFFSLGDSPVISSPYGVCVSKCPSTDCNLTTHVSLDCLSAGCHALPTQRIYVTTPNAGTGGTGPVAGENCAQPAAGGPYVHLEKVYSASANQPCVNCHLNVTPNYKGGFLYDAPDGTATVAEATVTLRPATGAPLSAVTGPGGMFFFGTVGSTTTAQTIPFPYTACVSKCPTSELCSLPNQHVTDADCGTCHDTYTTGKVYLR